ncbi:MAG: adenine deaminase C-terminal domain-containing protein, partial [Dehalococcoidia bacterium]|nr:adenine deaminase C-terminal domain-containing protein [Dehalococcoidia bacterium]
MTARSLCPAAADLATLAKVALGQQEADLVLRDGTLLNVFTGELLEGYSVAIKGERIAYVGKDASHALGSNTRVVDARGQYLVPGFVDGHTHLVDNTCTIAESLRFMIPGGVTTIATVMAGVGNVLGFPGLSHFLRVLEEQPIKIFALVPSMAPPYPELEQSTGVSEEELARLLGSPQVLGMGEVFWFRVLGDPEGVADLFSQCLRDGKVLEGHLPGLQGTRLVACAAAGVSSCHESSSVDEALERMRLGLYAMVRQNAQRRDLEAISQMRVAPLDFRRMVLVTDGAWPGDLLAGRHLGYVAQRAIDLGFDPVKVIQMVTLNPAEHFSLDGSIGAIAPGRYADILLLPSLKKMEPHLVLSNGRPVARDGRLLVELRKDEYPAWAFATVHLPQKLEPEDFAVSVCDEWSKAKVRAIQMEEGIITREVIVTLPVVRGRVLSRPKEDVLKAAVINRHDGKGRRGVGFVRGLGLRSGAFASTISRETCNIVVVGADDEDMAMAVNRLREIQGGLVVCQGCQVIEEIALPIAGIMSTWTLESVVQGMEAIQGAVASLGCPVPEPFSVLQVIPWT